LVTIHAATGASGGPFTAVAIVGAPGSGSTQISGTDILFTAAANSPATVEFTYTLSNAFGTSAPASVVVAVNPMPVAVSSQVNGIPGVALQVNLSSGASGGPFTAAALLAVAPSTAGQASISRDGAGDFILDFVPAVNSSGTVTIGFTLSNAYATSAPGTITVAITPRSDPSRDPEVLGLLNSQANATRRFATAQIANFQQRLESVHQRGLGASADTSEEPAKWSGWIGGAVDFGLNDPNRTARGLHFTTSGLSLGADRAFSPQLVAGAGIGFSHDSTDIGDNDSHSSGEGYSAALYASFHPGTEIHVDALIGYQRLAFDSRRYVTDNSNVVSGSRDGDQWFGSIAAGYDFERGKLSISPYLRLDMARATLDAYSERGDAIYGLDYRRQSVNTSTTSPGVHLDYRQQTRWGVVAPRVRLEYKHDFQGAGQAEIRYTDLVGGPLYRAKLSQYSEDRGLIGVGAGLQTRAAWNIGVDYKYEFSSGSREQSILLNVSRSF
jgi:outer membrane autotransporter protein